MSNRRWDIARRAWNMLRLWKMQTHHHHRGRLLRRFINRLAHPTSATPSRLRPHYAERQFSFDETPIIHLKMHRRPPAPRFHLPHIPCLNPKVDFDFDFDLDFHSCITDEEADRKKYGYGGTWHDDDDDEDEEEDAEDGIDLRAEKFINMFYEQMKLQNQISYLQFNEISDD